MKNALFLTGLAISSALFFSACQREKEFTGPTGESVTILLTVDDTRTKNDGMSTQWVGGDPLATFYAPAGTEDYSDNMFFSISDEETGYASGDAELTDGRYDWYVLYPYYGIASPDDRDAACIKIGQWLQTQTGNNNTAHLAGLNMPLYGVARNVPADEIPKVAMHQAAAVVAVNITNSLDEPITIKSITMNAPFDIVGSYSIDFSTGEPVYLPSPEEGAVSESVILRVNDPDPIPPGGSARFYLAVKPFMLSAGEEMTLGISHESDSRTLEITASEDISFKAGYIKNLKVNYGGVEKALMAKVRPILDQLYEALDGRNWVDPWIPGEHYPGMTYNPHINKIGLSFQSMGLKGEIPDCIGELGDMIEYFTVSREPGLTGSLPESFGQLVELTSFGFTYTSLQAIPDVFTGMKKLRGVSIFFNDELFCPLPASLGDSPAVEHLYLHSNRFTGGLPASWARFGERLKLWDNCLSGPIPQTYLDSEYYEYYMKRFLDQKEGYGFDITDIEIPGSWGDCYPPGEVEDLNGNLFTFDEVVAKNKYTVYINWAPWCPFSKELMPELRDYYEKYSQDGLEVIATVMFSQEGEPWSDEEGQRKEIEEKGYGDWYNFYYDPEVYLSYVMLTPAAEVYDSNGIIQYSSFLSYPDPVRQRFGKTPSADLIPFLETLFGPAETEEPYTSTDFSRDGEVLTLQTATVGQGINIVFLGDAYVDRDMEPGGLYETMMGQAMEEFFAIEPYKTFRNRFNVYAVKAVSTNNRIGEGYATALGVAFGNAQDVRGNDQKCYEYAQLIPGITSEENLLVCVMINTRRHAGTAALSMGRQSGVAYYSSYGNDRTLFGPTLRHEGGGHGFAFLADEYATHSGQAPADHITYYNSLYDTYGWYSNVDFTDDPAQIRWSAFLSDERYKDEVGIFEGGALYTKGAYRPSKNSMMNENMEYFNAPSRWAIYQQIMKRSGEEYSFEKFLEYDAVNRGKANAAAARPPLKAARRVEPGAPPVIKP